jgi:hypothetical protein
VAADFRRRSSSGGGGGGSSSGGGSDDNNPPLPSSFTLMVSVEGNGGVTSSPGGIDCGADCGQIYVDGTVVTLTAIPDDGFVFTAWTGDADCFDGSVTINTSLSCTANFAIETFTLDVGVVGNGTATSTLGSINCPDACSDSYIRDEEVTLFATPNPGSQFITWEGCDSATSTECTVRIVDTDRSVTVNFGHTLTVSVPGTGGVTSSPAGIDCGANCDQIYVDGTVVTLTPIPEDGFVFTDWTGDTDCSDGVVTMNVNVSCTANFSIETFTLTVDVVGSGTATSTPAGINCPSDCDEDYDRGQSVTLKATPDPGSVFAGWGIDCAFAGMSTSTQVFMNSDISCKATFNAAPSGFTSTVSMQDDAAAATATGINCGTGGVDCKETYPIGALPVALTAAPENLTSFFDRRFNYTAYFSAWVTVHLGLKPKV